jgi:bifunctional NMN adenylyltransferase/nudix hydrolase
VNLKVGVIIGRFQIPKPHAGHWELYHTVAARSDQVVFLLGISPVDGRTAENPLTFNQRRAIITKTFNNESRAGVTVLPLLDCRTNEEWSTQIDHLIRVAHPEDEITLYGGRDSFVESYKGMFPVERVNLVPLVPEAGTDHRAAIKEDQSEDFYRGQIYALRRQFPKVYPTVDMAYTKFIRHPGPPHEMQPHVLLIQRADSGRWCFPGGFVDPIDDSYEMAAKRELHEELSVISEAPLEHIGSYRVNDFRYRGSRDTITTTFFLVRHSWGAPRPNPDEVQDFKFVRPLEHEGRDILCDTHVPLWNGLIKYLLDTKATWWNANE